MSLPDFLARVAARNAELTRWTAEHPELAADWDAAAEEDDQRARMRAWEESRVMSLKAGGFPARCIGDVLAVRRGRLGETSAVKAARAFLMTDKAFLVLGGGVGSTKSTGATLAAFESCKRARFVRSTALSGYGQFDREWQRLLESQFLVIDDVGADKASDWWAARFGELVDVRYGDRLATVLTANASPEVLIESLGARIASRVRSDSVMAATGGRDRRPQGGA